MQTRAQFITLSAIPGVAHAPKEDGGGGGGNETNILWYHPQAP